MEARVSLAKRLEKIYDKRSTVAHSGLGNDKIQIEDYNFISKVLRTVIIRLLQLLEGDTNGNIKITHINRKEPLLADKHSLDAYLDKLKYS